MGITCDEIPEVDWSVDNPGYLLMSRLSLVLIEGLVLAGTGAAIGLGAAVAVSSGMGNFLYRVTALDPSSVAFATGVLFVVAMVASYLPARRAALSAPAETLRGA